MLRIIIVCLFALDLSCGSLQYDAEFQNHVMTTTSHSSLYDCSAACVADMCCKSFNFFTSTLECQLNYKTKEESSQDFVTKKASIYQDKDSIDKSVAGACGFETCLSGSKCHVQRDMNQVKCVPCSSDIQILSDDSSSNSFLSRPKPSKVTHNCNDVMAENKCSGNYKLTASEVRKLEVFCDMVTDCGGWLVIQRRMDGSTDFYRKWKDYKEGFGDVEREFWLGNEKIYQITNEQTYELRVDLEDFEGNKRYAMYSTFSLDSEKKNYALHIGSYSGNAGDSLLHHNNTAFTTRDKDRDTFEINCADKYHGAWWFKQCHVSHLNGMYLQGLNDKSGAGIIWSSWRGFLYSLKKTEMKIRPVQN